jgi:hypothetical protein
MRIEYEYDSYGNLTTQKNFSASDNWKFTYGEKFEYTYNGAGKILSKIRYWWNQATETWGTAQDEKTEYEYDTRGNRIQEISYTKRAGNTNWTITTPVWTYEFDAQNREIARNRYNSIRETGGKIEFLSGYRYETGYNGQGQKISETEYRWEVSGSQGVDNLVSKIEYEYNAQGKEVLSTNYKKLEILLDSYTRNTTKVNIYLAPVGLFKRSAISTAYDGRGYISTETEIFYKYPVPNFTIPNEAYNFTLPTPAPSTLPYYLVVENFTVEPIPEVEVYTQWYYRGSTGIIPAQKTDKVNLYYNPALNCISVSGLQTNEMLNFYNINGNLLFTRRVSCETESISVGHLPTGVYIVRTNKGQALKWIKK